MPTYPDTNVMLAVCHLLASYGPAPIETIVPGTGYSRVHVLDALWVLVTVGLVRREAGPPVVFKLVRFADVLDLAARIDRARAALAVKKSSAAGEPRALSPAGSPSETPYPEETTTAVQPAGCTVHEAKSPMTEDGAARPSMARGVVVDEWKSLLPGLKALGCTDIQAAGILFDARKHERPTSWLVEWMAETQKHANDPVRYIAAMVKRNADPAPAHGRRGEYREGDRVSPERKKQLDSFYDAEHERTRAANTRPTNRISNEEHDRQKEESGWTAMKEQLRSRIEAEAPADKWGARVYKRPTEEERTKIAEAKVELEARRKRQEPQETTSGVEPVSWEQASRSLRSQEARAAPPEFDEGASL